MKKIIYSLVIMIAAGSLFTSCVTNTEPQGIKDLREAKADYIESLSKLKEAEIEKVKAQAAVEQAKADYLQTKVEYQKIQNEIEQCKADSAKAKLSVILKDQEAALKRAEADLAQAEFELQQKLNNIAVWSQELTPAERMAINIYTDAYEKYIEAEQAVRKAESKVYYTDLRYAEIVQQLKIDTAEAAATIAVNQMLLENLPDSGASEAEIKALLAKYDQERVKAEYERANIEKEWNLYRQTEVAENIKGFATELSEWVVKNAALPAPFDMHFKAELPDNGAVSHLFQTSVEEFYGSGDSVSVKVDKGYICANFETSTDALEGVFVLDSIIDALSRKYIIDKVGTGLDTVGLKAAVKAAQDEYDAKADTLDKGLGKYEPFVAAQKAITKAVADTATAFAAYRKALSDDYAAHAAFTKDTAAHSAAVDTFNRYMDGKWVAAKNDSTAKGASFKTADAAHKTAHDAYTKGKALLDSLVNLDDYIAKAAGKAAEDSLRKENAQKAYDKASTDSANAKQAWKDAVAKDSSEAVIAKLKSKSDEASKACGVATTNLNNAKKAYDDAKKKLADLVEYKEINVDEQKTIVATQYAADTAAENVAEKAKLALEKAAKAYDKAVKDTAALYKACVDAKNKVQNSSENKFEADSLYNVAKADTAAAVKDLKFAADTLCPAAKKGFYALYGEFWGKELVDADFNENGFLNDSIKIAPKEFVDIFKKDGANDIVKFDPTYGYEDKNFTGSPDLVLNKEIKIIEDQLADHGVDNFAATLLCDLFAKQQTEEEIFAKVGTVENDEALKALTEIKDALADAFVEAGHKQEADSKPFFTFVENLFGKECIDGFFARLDSAATAAAEFVPATPGEKECIAKLIAEGKLTSKQIFTLGFEFFMCGGVSNEYRTAYEHFQIAKAFTGEAFGELLSDVIAAFIKSSPLEDVIKANPGENILEKILFGTVEKVTWEESSDLAGVAFKIVAPVVGPFLTGNFGGKIAELQDKYFTEWKEAWAQYDVACAVANATLDEINTEVEILRGYGCAVKEIILRAKVYEHKIEKAMAEYEDARQTLAAIEAGADPIVLWKEKVADRLAVANANLAAAADKLAAAEAAYRQVLANHGIAE